MKLRSPTLRVPRRNRDSLRFPNRQSSKVLIQEIVTHRYFQSGGDWTCEQCKATDFHSGIEALEQVTRLRLPNVQLVVTQELEESHIIPVRSSRRT